MKEEHRVLVTGATGSIGRQCLGPLRQRGYVVHTVSRHAPLETGDGLHHHACDLLDAAATRRLVAAVGPTHLLHLAWCTEPATYAASEDNLRWVEASLALARAFRAHGGRRFVGAGSCAEYGGSHGADHPLPEDAPTRPSTLYGAAKHALHLALAAWGVAHGVSMAWGRVFFMYGPGEAPGRLVASAIRAGLARRDLAFTTGTQIRDYQHVADTAGALVALLASPVEGAVNIASGQPRAVREILAAVAARLDATTLFHLGAKTVPDGERPAVHAAVTRLRDEVGWRDDIDLERGLDDAIAWWRAREPAW